MRAADELPAYLIQIPGAVKTVLVADTSQATLHRFDRAGEEYMVHGTGSHMSIGENGDGKERAGDRKTPLGIYFITGQVDTEKLHEKYGATAYPLDYPNAWDRRQQRTGDGIWLHGFHRRRGQRPPLDTDGCVALPNEVLTALADHIEANTTPVLITRQLRWAEPEELDALRGQLDSAVRRWAATLENGEIDAHLSLYADDFHHWGMNKADWSTLLADTVPERHIHTVRVDNLLLLGDPSEDDLYLSRFELNIGEADGDIEVMKRLYWRRAPDGRLLIVAEDAG